MKKTAIIVLCLLLVLSVAGCGKETAETANTANPGKSEIEEPSGEDFEFFIDTASLDIDSDGIYEDCSMTYGPTYGLFTIVITATVDGAIKYKNTFNINSGDLSFEEKDGIAQFVRDGEYHKLYVKNNIIVIDNLDPEYEGYWGGSEWNLT